MNDASDASTVSHLSRVTGAVSRTTGGGRKRWTYLSAVRAHVRTVRPEVSVALMSAPAWRASWTAEALPSEAAWRRAKFSKERCGRLIAGRRRIREGGRRRRRRRAGEE